MTPRRHEGEIVRAILDYLALRKDVVAWRVNSGAVTGDYKGKRRFVRFNSMPGMSDIIGWQYWQEHGSTAAYACFLAIEVKRPGEKPTPSQQSFLDLVTSHGGIALCASSVDDVRTALGEP